MKLQGKQPGAPTPKLVVIERDEETFAFTIQAVIDFTEFDSLCPEPKPHTIVKPGGKKTVQKQTDAEFVKKLEAHSTAKTHYMIIKSLQATENLEWDNVNISDPSTWENYTKEFAKAGFTDGEVAHLITQIFNLHVVDEEKMKQAVDRFTAGE